MIRRLIKVRFAVHYGLNSDIARGPVRANERTRSRGRALRRGRAYCIYRSNYLIEHR